jgi:HSP20 family protein
MASPLFLDPFRDTVTLHDALNQLFGQAVMRPGYGALSAGSGSALGQMNILEIEGRYYCSVLLPGANPDEIELTWRQNALTIKAKVPEPFPEGLRQKGTYLLHELGQGEFTRTVSFPKDLRGDAIEAQYEHGILTIEIPIAEHAQPKRVTIREGKGAQKRLVEAGADAGAGNAARN